MEVLNQQSQMHVRQFEDLLNVGLQKFLQQEELDLLSSGLELAEVLALIEGSELELPEVLQVLELLEVLEHMLHKDWHLE